MFWNSEFLTASPSHIDVLLDSQDTKLSDILFEEDILQEIKTSNIKLKNFLMKQETLIELVNNITQVTEEDCCDKSIYSRVHAAYVSCEILTACSPEIFDALLQNSDSLNKIISCLALHNQKVVPQKATLVSKLISSVHSHAPADLSCHITKNIDIFSSLIKVLVDNIDISGSYEILSTFINRTNPSELRYVFCEILRKFNLIYKLIDVMTISKHEDKQRNACQLLCDIIVIGRQEASEQANDGPTSQDMLAELLESREAVEYMLSHIFPSKSNKTGHNESPDKEAENNKFDNTNELGNNTDSLDTKANGVEVLETNGVEKHISNGVEEPKTNGVNESASNEDEESYSNVVDKLDSYRIENKTTEKEVSKKEETDGVVVVEEEEEAEVKDASHEVISDIIADIATSATETPNATAILCSLKVLQTLLEEKKTSINNNQIQNANSSIARTVEQIQDVLADNLVHFHELLLNPPKQEPIKTTFGIIQKPLGYMRLEVVNLIRALLSTNSPIIIKKLVELNTTKVIVDLFIEYSWNNLLHTQVERALCLIIKNCRHDEDQRDMKDLSEEREGDEKATTDDIPSRALLSQLLNKCDLIGRLLLPTRNDEQANFGHIIHIINSIAINCDLDTIQQHLNEMKDKRPGLYDRWTSFVNVDVASFKEISLYCDVRTLNNHVEQRGRNYFGAPNDFVFDTKMDSKFTRSDSPEGKETALNDTVRESASETTAKYSAALAYAAKVQGEDRELMAYLSFARETVIPSINVDVLPTKSRRSTKTNNF